MKLMYDNNSSQQRIPRHVAIIMDGNGRTSTPTHNHKQRMALRQQLKKVRKQLNHRHLSRSKRQRLLKLQKRLLKQLHRK